ncbi:MAG TPA: hypothetical protein VMB22_01865 [Verrucomicrobiae bacterium]|nr:hypothetical protein [Verrucomicrobiae bacterium]
MNARYKLFVAAALGLAMTGTVLAEPTAFDLAKNGDAYVGVQSKDKVLQIRSDKSIASLTPDIWYVDYYDPDSPLKLVEVKFGGGQEMNTTHPMRPFQMPASEHDILDWSKVKVDSDEALKDAAAQPLLKNLTLKASKMTLDHSDTGPVWKVQLWAAKLKNPNDIADIGTVTLSATDGSVVKSDLRPDRVD